MQLQAAAENALCATGLYRPTRNTYQRLRNRPYWAERAETRNFYRGLLPAPGLVFDIGANHGRLTETFLELGHQVVAVEPNPQLAERIARRYPEATVEQAALGDTAGRADLHLGHHDGHSTLSSEWLDASDQGRYAGTVPVTVTTLDALIERHGLPAFVKIDVEGFEPEVLAGLTHHPACVSFEYQCGAIEIAHRSLARLAELGYTEFARLEGESHTTLHWQGLDAITRAIDLHAAADAGSYGDVYAR